MLYYPCESSRAEVETRNMTTGAPQPALGPIGSVGHLEKLIGEGYEVRGPRGDPSKDLLSLKAFLRAGHEFAPEGWLSGNGYQFVEPSTFTRGRRLAYKLIDDFPDERFRSNYSLVRGDTVIPLYLKVEIKMGDG